jgi:hypothetical protein
MSRILTVLFLLLSLTATVFLIYRTTSLSSKASGSSPSSTNFVNNSYLFASPLQAKANGQEIIRVTAFILDNRGLGIPNLLVTLDKSPNLTLVATQDVTDTTGKATFDLTSITLDKYSISAAINGQSLPQKLTLNFN